MTAVERLQAAPPTDEPGAHGGPIPRYAMLDVWMALFGTSHPEFDEFYAEHGYAETWARLLAAVHRSAQVPATDDERLVRAVIEAWTVEGVSPAYHRDMQKSLATNWPRLQQAIVALVRGFRRSARVPVSRDELAASAKAHVHKRHPERHDNGVGIVQGSHYRAGFVAGAKWVASDHDIYPKADRKADDSGETRRVCDAHGIPDCSPLFNWCARLTADSSNGQQS